MSIWFPTIVILGIVLFSFNYTLDTIPHPHQEWYMWIFNIIGILSQSALYGFIGFHVSRELENIYNKHIEKQKENL